MIEIDRFEKIRNSMTAAADAGAAGSGHPDDKTRMPKRPRRWEERGMASAASTMNEAQPPPVTIGFQQLQEKTRTLQAQILDDQEAIKKRADERRTKEVESHRAMLKKLEAPTTPPSTQATSLVPPPTPEQHGAAMKNADGKRPDKQCFGKGVLSPEDSAVLAPGDQVGRRKQDRRGNPFVPQVKLENPPGLRQSPESQGPAAKAAAENNSFSGSTPSMDEDEPSRAEEPKAAPPSVTEEKKHKSPSPKKIGGDRPEKRADSPRREKARAKKAKGDKGGERSTSPSQTKGSRGGKRSASRRTRSPSMRAASQGRKDRAKREKPKDKHKRRFRERSHSRHKRSNSASARKGKSRDRSRRRRDSRSATPPQRRSRAPKTSHRADRERPRTPQGGHRPRSPPERVAPKGTREELVMLREVSAKLRADVQKLQEDLQDSEDQERAMAQAIDSHAEQARLTHAKLLDLDVDSRKVADTATDRTSLFGNAQNEMMRTAQAVFQVRLALLGKESPVHNGLARCAKGHLDAATNQKTPKAHEEAVKKAKELAQADALKQAAAKAAAQAMKRQEEHKARETAASASTGADDWP